MTIESLQATVGMWENTMLAVLGISLHILSSPRFSTDICGQEGAQTEHDGNKIYNVISLT